jgi:hypothetical protein
MNFLRVGRGLRFCIFDSDETPGQPCQHGKNRTAKFSFDHTMHGPFGGIPYEPEKSVFLDFEMRAHINKSFLTDSCDNGPSFLI